jgi:hypothetical protein
MCLVQTKGPWSTRAKIVMGGPYIVHLNLLIHVHFIDIEVFIEINLRNITIKL